MSTVVNSYGIDSANVVAAIAAAVASRNSAARVGLVPFMESPLESLRTANKNGGA
jgi:hypothetical protein